jgi:hypothetical protein
MFNKGDRIEITEKRPYVEAGAKGTVILGTGRGVKDSIGVKFDSDVKLDNGHNINGEINGTQGKWVSPNFLTKIKGEESKYNFEKGDRVEITKYQPRWEIQKGSIGTISKIANTEACFVHLRKNNGLKGGTHNEHIVAIMFEDLKMADDKEKEFKFEPGDKVKVIYPEHCVGGLLSEGVKKGDILTIEKTTMQGSLERYYFIGYRYWAYPKALELYKEDFKPGDKIIVTKTDPDFKGPNHPSIGHTDYIDKIICPSTDRVFIEGLQHSIGKDCIELHNNDMKSNEKQYYKVDSYDEIKFLEEYININENVRWEKDHAYNNYPIYAHNNRGVGLSFTRYRDKIECDIIDVSSLRSKNNSKHIATTTPHSYYIADSFEDVRFLERHLNTISGWEFDSVTTYGGSYPVLLTFYTQNRIIGWEYITPEKNRLATHVSVLRRDETRRRVPGGAQLGHVHNIKIETSFTINKNKNEKFEEDEEVRGSIYHPPISTYIEEEE